MPLHAGLNLEHVFSVDAAWFGWHFFEPRRPPIVLRHLGRHGAELVQEGAGRWPLCSRLVFTATDEAVDVTYFGTPLEDVWRKHGSIGIFFTSYPQCREDPAIHFIGCSHPRRGAATAR